MIDFTFYFDVLGAFVFFCYLGFVNFFGFFPVTELAFFDLYLIRYPGFWERRWVDSSGKVVAIKLV